MKKCNIIIGIAKSQGGTKCVLGGNFYFFFFFFFLMFASYSNKVGSKLKPQYGGHSLGTAYTAVIVEIF